MEWESVSVVPGYEVNRLGHIRHARKHNVLKPYVTSSGYSQVNLTYKSKSSAHLVHRLVAEAFLGIDESRPTVNHKNHIKTDNRLLNLEWMTYQEQNLHKRKRQGPSHGTERPICSVSMTNGTIVKWYPSARAASDDLNKRSGHITRAVRKGIAAYGYHWQYGPQDDDLPEEIWHSLPAEQVGATGFSISSTGRLKTDRGRVCTAKPRTDGYLGTKIAGKVVLIHRLVAESFIPRKAGMEIVNHRDGNKRNAAANNLEWTTNAGNAQHAIDTGLTKICRAVCQYTNDGLPIASYPSITLAGRKTLLFPGNIWYACQNTHCKSGGFYWRYSDE